MNITGDLRQVWSDHPDWTHILELDKKHFPRPWSSFDWLSLPPKNHILFSWVQEGEPVGFALFQLVPGDSVAHLLKILMSPQFHGTGRSMRFWEGICKALKSLGVQRTYLEVESSNHRAQGFYKKIGFQDLRVIRGYYADGMDAFTMDMEL